jgi:hypothetical protein
MTVARLASVLGGFIEPVLILKNDGLVDSILYVGTAFCVFSLIMGIILVILDAYADRKDALLNSEKQNNEIDKF